VDLEGRKRGALTGSGSSAAEADEQALTRGERAARLLRDWQRLL
jgi:hypothetical protein